MGVATAVTFFFSSRRRHTRYWRDWSSDVCSSDLNKAGIDRASFATVLTSGFYRRHQSLIVAGRKDIEIDCMLSWIGGIVTDQYEECFGSSSIGGFDKRFFPGLCPTHFKLDYIPFERTAELCAPIPV